MDTDFGFLVGIALFFAVVLIVKITSDNRIRNKLIDKGMVDENLKYLYPKQSIMQPISAIKWAFALVGIGLPLLLKQLFPESIDTYGIIGLMFIFAGTGFFVYYFMAKKHLGNE